MTTTHLLPPELAGEDSSSNETYTGQPRGVPRAPTVRGRWFCTRRQGRRSAVAGICVRSRDRRSRLRLADTRRRLAPPLASTVRPERPAARYRSKEAGGPAPSGSREACGRGCWRGVRDTLFHRGVPSRERPAGRPLQDHAKRAEGDAGGESAIRSSIADTPPAKAGWGRSSEDDPLPQRARSRTRRRTGSGFTVREREPA